MLETKVKVAILLWGRPMVAQSCLFCHERDYGPAQSNLGRCSRRPQQSFEQRNARHENVRPREHQLICQGRAMNPSKSDVLKNRPHLLART
eukprot:402477-Heterocapsa_arctica.AAC.1